MSKKSYPPNPEPDAPSGRTSGGPSERVHNGISGHSRMAGPHARRGFPFSCRGVDGPPSVGAPDANMGSQALSPLCFLLHIYLRSCFRCNAPVTAYKVCNQYSLNARNGASNTACNDGPTDGPPERGRATISGAIKDKLNASASCVIARRRGKARATTRTSRPLPDLCQALLPEFVERFGPLVVIEAA
eukprot:scaffold1801_cov57-Phaeocystis_antarctica.AAC.5